MLRKDFIEKVAERFPTLPEADVGNLCRKLFNEIAKELRDGNRVEIRGFGVFFCREQSIYFIRSPRDGKLIEVGGKKIPRFKAGRELTELVDNVD